MGQLTGIARRDAKRAPMQTLESAEVSAQAGVAHDFRGKAGRRQVTVLDARAWRRVCAELDADLPWTLRRANLLVDGLDLPKQAGDLLTVGQVVLRIERETDPCSRMDEQHAGLRKALEPDWRGGVCCSVVQGGQVAVGDTVSLNGSA